MRSQRSHPRLVIVPAETAARILRSCPVRCRQCPMSWNPARLPGEATRPRSATVAWKNLDLRVCHPAKAEAAVYSSRRGVRRRRCGIRPSAAGVQCDVGLDPTGLRQGAVACGRVVRLDCTRMSGVCHTRHLGTTHSIPPWPAFDPTSRQSSASVEAAEPAAAIWRIVHPVTSDRRTFLADGPFGWMNGWMDWTGIVSPFRCAA